MPSGITHVLLTRNLPFDDNDTMLKAYTAANLTEFSVGSVAPDLPYASRFDNDLFLTNQDDTAFDFHHHHTNKIPLYSLEYIRNHIVPQNNLRKTAAHFSFFAGYASHVIADGICHPFVMDKVGLYEGHEAEHRALELCLDVLVLAHFSKSSGSMAEVRTSEIEDVFHEFLSRPFTDSIMDQFSAHINDVYQRPTPTATIKSWVTGIYRMFDISAGGWPSWVTGIDVMKSLLMQSLDQIIDNKDDYLVLHSPSDWPDNFIGWSQVHFIDDCIPKFNAVMLAFLRKAYTYIFEDGPALTASDIPEFSLDTGRSLADEYTIDLQPVLWS